MVSLSRRQFFQTSVAGLAAFAAACSSEPDPFSGPILVALFSRQSVFGAGVPQRVSFGLLDNGVPVPSETEELPVRVTTGGNLISELTVTGRLVDHEHTGTSGEVEHEHASLLRYYALRTTFPEPGVYDIEVDFGDFKASLPVQIFPNDEVELASVGDRFPDIETPTLADTQGVDPLCSRDPVCDLHSVSAGDIVGTKPMAVLIATPAFCATQYCGPVLDVMLDEVDNYPAVEFIHVEVFENPREVGGDYSDPNIRPAKSLDALNLEFEPSLFLVGGDGIIVDRIDNVFDSTELKAALDAL